MTDVSIADVAYCIVDKKKKKRESNKQCCHVKYTISLIVDLMVDTSAIVVGSYITGRC